LECELPHVFRGEREKVVYTKDHRSARECAERTTARRMRSDARRRAERVFVARRSRCSRGASKAIRRCDYETVRPNATAEMYKFLAHLSLTCVDGNALVRNVSWVSSPGRRRGIESTKAA